MIENEKENVRQYCVLIMLSRIKGEGKLVAKGLICVFVKYAYFYDIQYLSVL